MITIKNLDQTKLQHAILEAFKNAPARNGYRSIHDTLEKMEYSVYQDICQEITRLLE